jgi:glutathione S-transferase
MITLHGAAASRASRSLLALEELGLPYEHRPLAPWSDAADAETLARINPNARVPVLDDDGLVLWESMAVNLYLADRYGAPPFWPQDPRDRAGLYMERLEPDGDRRPRASSGAVERRRSAQASRRGRAPRGAGDPRSRSRRAGRTSSVTSSRWPISTSPPR